MVVCTLTEELKFQLFAKLHPKILIIDDEDGFRKVLEDMFSILGCKVSSAENGKVGLDIYKLHKIFDLVILDMQMPVMDGRMVYRRIKKITRDQKILIMSGYANYEDLDDVMKQDAIGFIKKPFSIYKIIGKVKNIIFE